RVDPCGPDRAGARLPAEGMGAGRQALLPLRAGHADPGFLLVPVGALQGRARQVARREPGDLPRPAASVQRRTDVQGDEIVAGLLHDALRAIPVPPVAILEFPDYSSFAQSFANTIPFSES